MLLESTVPEETYNKVLNTDIVGQIVGIFSHSVFRSSVCKSLFASYCCMSRLEEAFGESCLMCKKAAKYTLSGWPSDIDCLMSTLIEQAAFS